MQTLIKTNCESRIFFSAKNSCEKTGIKFLSFNIKKTLYQSIMKKSELLQEIGKIQGLSEKQDQGTYY